MSEPEITAPPEESHDRFAERRALFQHQPPAGYADEMADVLARIPEEDAGYSATMLVFRVASLRLAIPSRALASVSRTLQPSPLPHRRSGPVLGLVAYRGEVIPCCSIVRLMGVADFVAHGATARTLILADDAGKHWAVPVDEVMGISTGAVRIDPSSATNEWTHGTFEDAHSLSAQMLRLDTLMERMKKAIA